MVRRHRRFRRVVLSDALSGTGDTLYWVALLVVLLGADPRGGLVAAAVAVRLIPRAVFGAIGGVVADRFDRRRLIVVLDTSRAAVMLAMAAVAAWSGPPIALLALVLALGVLSTPYRPAIGAAVPRLVGEDDLAAANALSNGVAQVTALTGPLLGAAILVVADPATAFVVNGLTYVASVALLVGLGDLGGGHAGAASIGRPDAQARSSRLATGFAVVRADRPLAAVMALIATTMLLRGFELVFHVSVAADRLGLGSAGYGLISGALGAGALAATPSAGRVAAGRHPGLVLIGSSAIGAASLALLALVQQAWVAAVILAVEGASIVCFEVVAVTVLQRLCPPAVLGRILGLQNTASGGAKLVAALVAPAFAAAAGLPLGLVLAAVVVAVPTAALAPAVLGVDRRSAEVLARIGPIVAVLEDIGMFTGATRPALERLAMQLQVEPVVTGTAVVREGDPADAFYVVRAGPFVATVEDRTVNRLGPDDWFGEIGLLRTAPRTASITATTDGEVWRIGGDVFLAAVGSAPALPEPLLDSMTRRTPYGVLPPAG